MKNRIYLRNIEIIIMACIVGMDEFPGFDITCDEYEERELKQILFQLIKKGYISIDDSEYVLNEELASIFEIIRSAKTYGICNSDSFFFISHEGVLSMSVNHKTTEGYTFYNYSWGELCDEWKEAFGDRENPETAEDEIVKKAYDMALSESDDIDKRDVPFTLKLFHDPETKEGTQLIGVTVGIYRFMVEKKAEDEAEISDFSVDQILNIMSRYEKGND